MDPFLRKFASASLEHLYNEMFHSNGHYKGQIRTQLMKLEYYLIFNTTEVSEQYIDPLLSLYGLPQTIHRLNGQPEGGS